VQPESVQPEEITAIVLCGGSGSRLGGVDKPTLRVGDRRLGGVDEPTVRVGGRRLVEYVIAALAPQVAGFVLSCGRDAAPYADLGHITVTDLRPGDGPLGGIVSALGAVETDWILTHPGDAPFAHASLVSRLAPAALAVEIAVPLTGVQRQNLVLLLSRSKADALARFYRRGGRAVRDWLDAERAAGVDMTDIADSFFNVNTAADLAACERRLRDAC
jgi:molybdopterin-guanine dinucleotide biosynthesis protein A